MLVFTPYYMLFNGLVFVTRLPIQVNIFALLSSHSPITSNFSMRGATMANTNQEKLIILRRKQVERRTGLSRSTIYLRIQEGTFPRPISLGVRAVGWLENEIEAWLVTRMKIRNNS